MPVSILLLRGLPLVGLALCPSCIPIVVGQIITDQKLEQLSSELGVNVWKDATQVERLSVPVYPSNEADARSYAGATAPAWSYSGMSVRLAANCERDNRVHSYLLQVRAHSKSGVFLQVAIDGFAEFPPGTSSLDNHWLSFDLDQAAIQKLRQDGAIVRVRCEVGDWVFRWTPSYVMGFEGRLRSMRVLPEHPTQ